MPSEATRNLFVWASGFGMGALVVLVGFVFLVGIGVLGHGTVSGPQTATQSSAVAPPAQTNPSTAKPETTGQSPKAEPSRDAPKPGAKPDAKPEPAQR
jgi:hypothetical protein